MTEFAVKYLSLFILIWLMRLQCNLADQLNSVVNVDLLTFQNSQQHYTTRFYSNGRPNLLIIRRGGTFQMRVHLRSPFFDTQKIQLHFRLQTEQGDYNVYTPSSNPQGWITNFDANSNTVDVRVTLPINIPVGFWTLYIYTYDRNNLQNYNEYVVNDIVILFNPWLPQESVYMENSNELDEYIFNESGFIITGSNRNKDRRSWIFGQFKRTTLRALKMVLNKLQLDAKSRADPIMLSRSLSAIVNIQDDDGIMEGRWRPPYNPLNGVPAQSPLLWVGSPEILERYLRYNGKSIGYAQCWVFACLIATFGRALGIPSRIITTYEAGHDYDANITIHFELNDRGEINIPNSESIWNYHVWTEMWMKRYDLSDDGWKFGGWQVVDGTPQQRSYETDPDNPKYQVGPSPVIAVKQSLVNIKYDTRFVYAEVNADTIYRNMRNEVINYRVSRIGLGSYTRAFNGEILDVTLDYKEPEGTYSDRLSFNRAIQAIYGTSAVTPRYTLRKKPRDFQVQYNGLGSQKIGSKVDFFVTVTNDYHEHRHFNVYLNVYSVYYNGEKGNDILRIRYGLNLDPYSENRRSISINQADYIHKLVPFSIVRTEIVVHTPNRKMYFEMFDLSFEKPTLIVKTYAESARIGFPFYFDVQISNPLNVTLTDCVFVIHGLRLNGDLHYVYPIAPYETRFHRFALVFDIPIIETVIVMFASTELDQISTQLQIPVQVVY